MLQESVATAAATTNATTSKMLPLGKLLRLTPDIFVQILQCIRFIQKHVVRFPTQQILVDTVSAEDQIMEDQARLSQLMSLCKADVTDVKKWVDH